MVCCFQELCHRVLKRAMPSVKLIQLSQQEVKYWDVTSNDSVVLNFLVIPHFRQGGILKPHLPPSPQHNANEMRNKLNMFQFIELTSSIRVTSCILNTNYIHKITESSKIKKIKVQLSIFTNFKNRKDIKVPLCNL